MVGDFLSGFVGSSTSLPSRVWGDLRVQSVSLTPATDGDLVVFFGKAGDGTVPLVRIHSECVFGELLDSALCECRWQLAAALRELARSSYGILFYLRFDGRGAGLAAKVRATELEVAGVDTYHSRLQIGVPPEGRDFEPIARYLVEHEIRELELLSNNPAKIRTLEKAGIVVKPRPLLVDDPSEHERILYKAKREYFGHLIPDELT